ncbi:MAG: hypothetical protein BWZ10_02292 [candidate division BRC1 bacterium ADurb.BinA364]|nr:MAG: hypothetical protein BWZ10_02292 [candidate division BRC1 bacterium ADurb.BinA364]
MRIVGRGGAHLAAARGGDGDRLAEFSAGPDARIHVVVAFGVGVPRHRQLAAGRGGQGRRPLVAGRFGDGDRFAELAATLARAENIGVVAAETLPGDPDAAFGIGRGGGENIRASVLGQPQRLAPFSVRPAPRLNVPVFVLAAGGPDHPDASLAIDGDGAAVDVGARLRDSLRFAPLPFAQPHQPNLVAAGAGFEIFVLLRLFRYFGRRFKAFSVREGDEGDIQRSIGAKDSGRPVVFGGGLQGAHRVRDSGRPDQAVQLRQHNAERNVLDQEIEIALSGFDADPSARFGAIQRQHGERRLKRHLGVASLALGGHARNAPHGGQGKVAAVRLGAGGGLHQFDARQPASARNFHRAVPDGRRQRRTRALRLFFAFLQRGGPAAEFQLNRNSVFGKSRLNPRRFRFGPRLGGSGLRLSRRGGGRYTDPCDGNPGNQRSAHVAPPCSVFCCLPMARHGKHPVDLAILRDKKMKM